MATVKKANVPPTHPSVYVGLVFATIGLLVAVYSYTGARVYEIRYAVIAAVGAFLALVGIFVASWGRSIMASRASRSRRTTMSRDAMAITAPEGSESAPTIAVPSEKKRFRFPRPARIEKETPAQAGALFAFKRQPTAATRAPDDPRDPIVAARIAAEPALAGPIRATLKCPQCSSMFVAEGTRPFEARCDKCGFTSTV